MKSRSWTLIELGQMLAGCRKKANLTQSAVAEKLGISRHAVSRMERGLRDSAIVDAMAFARACGQKLTVHLVSVDKPQEQLVHAIRSLGLDRQLHGIVVSGARKATDAEATKMLASLTGVLERLPTILEKMKK